MTMRVWRAARRSAPPTPEAADQVDDFEPLRRAERCPHRSGCDCVGVRCGPGGKRPGQVVTIADCLACLAGGM